MLKNLSAFLIGLIFGVGLIVAQMTNPNKIQAFLDISGNWDASLAFVMASALLILGSVQRIVRRTDEEQENLSGKDNSNANIDAKLIIGASLFGIGWGLSGICPGPAIVGLTSGIPDIYLFTSTMFAGFWLFNLLHSA